MDNPVFLSINYNFIAEEIYHAKKSVFLASPGLTKDVTDALIMSSLKLGGWDNITVVIDPSPITYYIGYAEHDAFKKLHESGCKIKCENNLRIGLLIIDGQVYVFSPLSLSLESDDESAEDLNALALYEKPARHIIEAINPEGGLIEPEIGKRNISEIEVKRVDKTVYNNPPQKPDLTRRISVLTSQFQFVNLTFKGSQLKNTRISLKGRELGIVDEDLVERISGQYKIFEQLPEKYEKGMYVLKNKYKHIKEQFTKTIGEYGTIIWVSQSKDFEEAIKKLQEDIIKFNKDIIQELVKEINKSKERLKKFVNENYKVDQYKSFNHELAKRNKDKVIENIIEVEKNLELKLHYYNISSQMVSDEGFNKKIEELLGVKLDDLVKHENAFGIGRS